MSRTDKDQPHHVTATWWRPWHHRCANTYVNRSIGATRPAERECDLPAEPDPKHWRDHRRGHCEWMPVWERHHCPNPPKWYVNHVWTARERLAARVDCLNAAKEHRGGGGVDTVPTIRQNRHCAQWLWN